MTLLLYLRNLCTSLILYSYHFPSSQSTFLCKLVYSSPFLCPSLFHILLSTKDITGLGKIFFFSSTKGTNMVLFLQENKLDIKKLLALFQEELRYR